MEDCIYNGKKIKEMIEDMLKLETDEEVIKRIEEYNTFQRD